MLGAFFLSSFYGCSSLLYEREKERRIQTGIVVLLDTNSFYLQNIHQILDIRRFHDSNLMDFRRCYLEKNIRKEVGEVAVLPHLNMRLFQV